MSATPIDPLEGGKLALSGRVVTMDARNRVLNDAVIFVDAGRVVAVRPRHDPPPQGFENVHIRNTEGTIFPGLIELHNHLPYDVLPLWRVPKKFAHRGQWSGTEEYRRLITTPMTVLGRSRYVPSVIRYVECKALLGGVTTTQGIELFSNAGVRRYYRGIVRNVEQTDDPLLPEAATRIADVEAKNAKRFLERLQSKRLILHLSEGVGEIARRHFLALHIEGRHWAINENLVGIHCTGLQARDFSVLARHGGSMVWSPFSNLLLYGETADVKAAKHEGVAIALGSDWSPTGSKNLLGELKVARLFSRQHNELFTDRELVEMVTKTPAHILGWSNELGSIGPGKRADFTVVDSDTTDPYTSLLHADESEVRLVMIAGVARAGIPSLMRSLVPSLGSRGGEQIRVGGRPRLLYLAQKTGDPAVGKLTLHAAQQRLEVALSTLPRRSRKVVAPTTSPNAGITGISSDAGVGDDGDWSLALDELMITGMNVRHHLPLAGESEPSGPMLPRRVIAASPDMTPTINLDALSVVDDHDYLDLIAEEEHNLPRSLPAQLRKLYA